MHLNHLHLCVPDVAAVSAFFVRHFGFRLHETRGNNGFASLAGDAGFVLVLMKLSANVAPEQAYPPMFHVGFLLGDESQLAPVHAGLMADGHEPSDIELMRGARRFYCKAPGGLFVEVGHEPQS